MTEKPPKTTLRVVGDPGATPPSPSSTFGEAGQRLWSAVQAEFDVSDVARPGASRAGLQGCRQGGSRASTEELSHADGDGPERVNGQAHYLVGSGLIDQSQKRTAAAMQIAEK
jgi:hypothetical protein